MVWCGGYTTVCLIHKVESTITTTTTSTSAMCIYPPIIYPRHREREILYMHAWYTMVYTLVCALHTLSINNHVYSMGGYRRVCVRSYYDHTVCMIIVDIHNLIYKTTTIII